MIDKEKPRAQSTEQIQGHFPTLCIPQEGVTVEDREGIQTHLSLVPSKADLQERHG